MTTLCPEIEIDVTGVVGCITLNRPKALNALSLPMIRAITTALQEWRANKAIGVVAIRGMGKEAPFGQFCAGGDIRFFHSAALAGLAQLEDFFTEEYALNHLIHHFGKPILALMDGIVMGGGMGLAQGASHRIVTENSKLAMPETLIGLFPDVGAGYFLSRLPGRLGEWLALTGTVIHGASALQIGWADSCLTASALPQIWRSLADLRSGSVIDLNNFLLHFATSTSPSERLPREQIDQCFSQPSVGEIILALKADGGPWAQQTIQSMAHRSPLMLHVALEQIRRARSMNLAEALRMERDMVRHCFHPLHLRRNAAQSETVEGIRALAIDKDHQPRWNPARIDEVTPAMVAPFFISPWPAWAHPLRDLRG